MTAVTKSSAALPKAGELIANKYRIERMIGAGGMGAVYVALHELLREKVAIKVLLPEVVSDSDSVTRFLNEARNATRIRNEHVARVIDVDTLPNGVPYMVMEYLEGHDLGQCQQVWGAIPIGPAVDYVLQALEALADAHALGIIHRDLKPANLFLTKHADGSDIIKVLDFGISKSTDLTTPLADSGGVTNTKAILGSPGYMAPEQIKNAKHVDARADIWSIGIILYKLITNQKPFNGETMGEVFAAIFEETPKPLRQFRPDCPPGLEEIVIGRCLQRDRDKRFRNVGEFAAALVPYGLPTSGQSLERIRRRLGASSLHGNTMSPSTPRGLGGSTDHSSSVSHVSQISQDARQSQLSASVSGSHSLPSHSSISQSHASQSHSSQHGVQGGEAFDSVLKNNRVLLLIAVGVLALLIVGGVAFTAKAIFDKRSAEPSSSQTAAATTTTPKPTATHTTADTPVATVAPTDRGVAIDAPPTKPISGTTPTSAITATAKSTTTSATTGKPSATAKSSAPSDDILKLGRH